MGLLRGLGFRVSHEKSLSSAERAIEREARERGQEREGLGFKVSYEVCHVSEPTDMQSLGLGFRV